MSAAPKNTPTSQLTVRAMAQRNCLARKNAAIGSDQRYHTPCTNVQMAINGAIHNGVHHLGGAEPRAAQKNRMVNRPAMVSKNGRPRENRPTISEVRPTAVNATSQASGRFNHGNGDPLARINKATTANTTSPSVSHLLQR